MYMYVYKYVYIVCVCVCCDETFQTSFTVLSLSNDYTVTGLLVFRIV